MKKHFIHLAAALCLACTGTAFAADGMARDAYQAEKDKIETQAKADRKACDALKENAKAVCKAEAKGTEKIAKAELDARNRPGPAADARVKTTRADAGYDVARQRCDTLKGNARDVCRKEAKVGYESAKGQARIAAAAGAKGRNSRAVAEERREAAKETANARYDAAKERCEGMKDAARDKCMANAKKRFNKA